MCKSIGLTDTRLGRKSYFSVHGKVALMILKSYTGFSDADLIEHLNGNIYFQMFCDIWIDPGNPLRNPKLVSSIRCQIASLLDIDSAQQALAEYWKPYLDNLHVNMSDATCYESSIRYPTGVKLLWEGIGQLHRHICKICKYLIYKYL